MEIKKLFQTILSLTGAMLLFVGCIKDEIVSATDGLVDMQLSITRSAANSNGEATDAEMAVKDIYVYILDADGKLENPGEIRVDASPLLTSVDSSTDRINKKWRVKRGMKSIYVVINGERSMGMNYPSLFAYSSDYDFVHAPFIEGHLPKTNPAWVTRQYAGFAKSSKVVEMDMVTCLNRYTDLKMMSGCKENFLADQQNGICVVTVPVKRRYAAVELYLRKSAGMSDAAVVKVKQIKFGHFSTWTSIFDPVPFDPYDNPGPSANENLTDADKDDFRYVAVKPSDADKPETWQTVSASAPGNDYTRMKVYTYHSIYHTMDSNNDPVLNSQRFYVYPRTKETSLSAAGVPTIEIVADINGKEKVYTAYISELDKDGRCDKTKPIDILGNHIYRIQATLTPAEATVELNILDWNDQSVDGDILGMNFQISQNPVVMDWWNLGESFTTQLELTASENITFEGYESNDKKFTDSSMLPAWLSVTESTLPSGSTKSAQVHLKYNIDTVAAKYPVYLCFKAGNIGKKVEVVYDNGFLPNELLATNGWILPSSVAGIYLAKKGNKHPTATADDNYVNERMQWANTAVPVPFAQNAGFGFGPFNTTVIMDALGTAATAAVSCRSLGSDWYLPSVSEAYVVAGEPLQNALGGSYKMKEGALDIYYTSSEVPASDGSLVWTVVPSIYLDRLQQSKSASNYVRALKIVGNVSHKVTMQTDPLSINDVVLHGGGSYKAGSVVGISYRNNTSYSFVKFIPSVNDVDIIHLADDFAYFVMPDEDITITARFVAPEWKPDMSGWAAGDLIVKEVGGEVQLTIGTATDVGPAFKWGSLIGLGISDNQVKFKPEEYKGNATNVQTAPIPTIECDGDANTNHLLAVHDPEAGTGDICVYASRKWPQNFNNQLWRMPTRAELEQIVGNKVSSGNPSIFATPYGDVSFFMNGYLFWTGSGTPDTDRSKGSYGPRWTSTGCNKYISGKFSSGKPASYVVALDTGAAYADYPWGRTSAFNVRCVVDE